MDCTIETPIGKLTYDTADVIEPEEVTNPYKRPYLIWKQMGFEGRVLAIVYEMDQQDALDAAADAGKLDSLQVSDEEYLEAKKNAGIEDDPDQDIDNVMYLGNASEPFWDDDVSVYQVPQAQYGFDYSWHYYLRWNAVGEARLCPNYWEHPKEGHFDCSVCHGNRIFHVGLEGLGQNPKQVSTY